MGRKAWREDNNELLPKEEEIYSVGDKVPQGRPHTRIDKPKDETNRSLVRRGPVLKENRPSSRESKSKPEANAETERVAHEERGRQPRGGQLQPTAGGRGSPRGACVALSVKRSEGLSTRRGANGLAH